MPQDPAVDGAVPEPIDGDRGGAVPSPARGERATAPRRGPTREYSAGGVVMRRIDGRVHILLIRDPYQNWGLPKGHVEEGEEPRDAALREVREETGLQELKLGPVLGTIDWFFRLDRQLVHKFCTFFVMGSARGAPVPETGEGITDCVWVPATEAAGRITYENAREVVTEAVRRLGEDGLAVVFGDA